VYGVVEGTGVSTGIDILSAAATDERDAEVIQEISNWLIDQGLVGAYFESILSGFCLRLEAAGVNIHRGMMAMRTLHPSVDAETFIWQRGGQMKSTRFSIDSDVNSDWQRSTIRHMLDTREFEFRRRLEGPEAEIDFAILADLAAEGMTEYYARVIEFSLGGVQSMETGLISSWTTDRAGGFSDHDIAILERLLPRLALTAKTLLTEEVAENVLDTYVGPDAGRRIMRGDIRRGSLDVIRAVLLYADLRDFTSTTDSVDRAALAPMLDSYFEQILPPIVERGGQILKFLGDGLLATFDLAGRPNDSVCRDALEAGYEAMNRVAALNVDRAAAGEPVMPLDIAMHLGDVLYGNIGAADRQDFTVIGPAVNEANRIEALCEGLGHHFLISETFAAAATACADKLIPLGRHALRDVRETQALFTIDTSA